MSNVALCKCGTDMTDHDDLGHDFDAAGTRYRCGGLVGGYQCARPAYHDEHDVPCGPITGEKLW